MKKLLLFAFASALFTSSAFAGLNCQSQVKEIFAQLISIQTKQKVKAEHIRAAELTKYQWTINGPGEIEYLAVIDNDQNCNILSMIEAEGEEPKFNYNWEKD